MMMDGKANAERQSKNVVGFSGSTFQASLFFWDGPSPDSKPVSPSLLDIPSLETNPSPQQLIHTAIHKKERKQEVF